MASTLAGNSSASVGKTKRGFLSKQGGSAKGWKRRWCIFENNALFYYKQEQDKEQAGVIYAEDMRSVAPNEEESKKNSKYAFCFEIQTKERVWMFCADTKQEMDEWIEFIRSVWEDDDEQPTLEGGLQYATIESFIGQGLRVNGSVESAILSKLSEGATAKQKRKDARGWFCEKYVPPVHVLSIMGEFGWTLAHSYKTQAILADSKLQPANMMVFNRPYRAPK